MATINGTILRADTKTSAKGNTYHRLQVAVDGGGEKWYTYFGNLHGNYVGAACVFALKEGKARDGYPPDMFIEDYNILSEDANVTGFTAPDTAAATSPAAVTTQPARVGGHRDMWIMSECIYQHWIARCSDVSAGDVQLMVQHSTNLAMWVDTQFKAYDAGKPLSMAAQDAQAPSGPLVEKVGDIAARAISGGSDELDDDIPW